MAVKTDDTERVDELVPLPDVPPTPGPMPMPPEHVRPSRERRYLPPRVKAFLVRLFTNRTFLIVASLVLLSVLFSFSVVRCISSAKHAYSAAKAENRQLASEAIANFSYAKGEHKYHTSGRVAINVDSVRETAKLEVLNVSTVVYFSVEENGKPRYLEANGSGVFTVDLSAGEYICDDTDHYVLVRVPEPELGSNIALEKVDSLTGMVKGATSEEGVIQGLSDNESASRAIENTFKHNPSYNEMAKDAAKILIPALLRGLNSDIPDLTVEVQFMS